MAYQNYKHHNKNNSYGWWSSPSNEEYQYEATQQTSRHHHHQHNKNKGRVVAFYDEPIVEAREAESARFGDHSAFESVDQEADAFIQYEHKRMELAKLMSMRTA